LAVLQDADGDGKAERIERPFARQVGGTGIAVFRGRVFLESGNRIISYPLDDVHHQPGGAEQVVVSELPTEGDHFSHSIAIAADGSLFVTSGSATNACQTENRKAGAPGQTPCAEKALRAGIWRFDATKTNQRFSADGRFASGIRNAVEKSVGSSTSAPSTPPKSIRTNFVRGASPTDRPVRLAMLPSPMRSASAAEAPGRACLTRL
jgi:glucose/arabinose dehydrogenase